MTDDILEAEDSVRRFFGQRMREVRERLNTSQENIARSLGVTQTAVSYWEAGKREPSLYVLGQLAVILQTDLNYLIRGEETADHHAAQLLRTLAARIGSAASVEAERMAHAD